MKKTVLKALLGLSLIASTSAVVISCSSKDNEDLVVTESNVDPNNFRGDITTNVTLDPSKVYTINGKVAVKAGGSLTIPEGTRIRATSGFKKADGTFEVSYLIVERGAKIYINGTAAKPVVFEGTEHKQGHWGGIVVLGSAPSNRSAAGTSTSELGDLTYGGTNKTDNSGSLKYLVIKDSGYKYNPEKEFNGLSLFGVGSGTTVSYIYVTNGADDGVEMFGGNVNADHIIVTGVGDDSFDWTESWSGTVDFLYAARMKAFIGAVEPGNRGIEADTQDSDANTTNGANGGISNPTVKNVTLIGNTAGPESQGIKVKAGSQGKFDNVVIANFKTGLDFETDRTIDWFKDANNLNNIRFVNVGAEWVAKATTKNPNPDMSKAFIKNDKATGAGNGTALPDWAKGWTGLTSFDIADAGN